MYPSPRPYSCSASDSRPPPALPPTRGCGTLPIYQASNPQRQSDPILSARYLNPSRDSSETKQATSVVITDDPQNVSALTSGVVILSQKRKVELAFSSSSTSQCRNRWRYGHAHQRCPATHPTCPICWLHYTRAAHRCQNPTCPGSGNNKPVPSCCPTSPPHCCNCGKNHTATYRECPARPPRLSPPEPTGQVPPRLVKTQWIWRSIAVCHPLLPRPGRVPMRWP